MTDNMHSAGHDFAAYRVTLEVTNDAPARSTVTVVIPAYYSDPVGQAAERVTADGYVLSPVAVPHVEAMTDDDLRVYEENH